MGFRGLANSEDAKTMDLKEPRGVCFAGLMADRNGIAALAAAIKIG
jgi:hypothetical protein